MIYPYSISIDKFNQKPARQDFSKIIYRKKGVELSDLLDEMCDEIKAGHVFTHNYKVIDDEYKAEANILKKNFDSTHIIAIDFDSVIINIEMINKYLSNKPSILYSTFSHKDIDKERRFRLIYAFQNPIEGENEFHVVYDAIASQISYDLKNVEAMDNKKLDINMRRCTQIFIGSKSDCSLINNYITYDKRKFISCVDKIVKTKSNDEIKSNFEIKDKKISNTKTKNKINNKVNNNSIKSNNSDVIYTCLNYSSKWKTIEEEFNITNNDFVDLFKKNLSKRDNIKVVLLRDYKKYYTIFDSQELKYNQFGYAILDENYKSIIRIWKYDKITNKNSIQKVKVGIRKKTLYNTSLRLLKMRDISFDHLLYLLIYEVYNFYEKQYDFPLNDIFDVAFSSYNTNLSNNNNIFFDKNHKKIKVDKNYCITNKINPKKLARRAQRVEKEKEIGRFYDSELSIKENLEILNSKGIKICKSRLYEYKRDLNEPQINFFEECQKANSKTSLKFDNIKEMEESFEKQKKVV